MTSSRPLANVATIAQERIWNPAFSAAILRTAGQINTIGRMPNVQGFVAGDFLVFQIESGFGLMRILKIDEADAETIWHLTVYGDLFPDIDFAELAIASPESLTTEIDHVALTDRAFESTQVSRLGNAALGEYALKDWDGKVSDRSIRLLLGFR